MPTHEVTTRVWVDLPAQEAFDVVLGELSDALGRHGIVAELQASGKVYGAGEEIGAVSVWKPGQAIHLEWRPSPWKPGLPIGIRIEFEPVDSGTRISWEVRDWDRVLSEGGVELAEWVAGTMMAATLNFVTPSQFGDWLTDRRARRPSGKQARETYRDPKFHWPNFLLILDKIALTPQDRLLEVGCGGGAFLHRALESGCSAVAIDHSPEMVRLAREVNRGSIDGGRLRILEAEADRLPVQDEEFTCAVMTGVFGFLPNPVAALKELRRSLIPGGRIAVFTGTASLRGTPAAPEPMASRLHFYDSDEMRSLAAQAGFVGVRLEEPPMDGYARAAGLPDEVVQFFREVGGAQLLLARRAP